MSMSRQGLVEEIARQIKERALASIHVADDITYQIIGSQILDQGKEVWSLYRLKDGDHLSKIQLAASVSRVMNQDSLKCRWARTPEVCGQRLIEDALAFLHGQEMD